MCCVVMAVGCVGVVLWLWDQWLNYNFMAAVSVVVC